MKAVILVGGLGTRLRPLTNQVPKPLIPLLGKPLVSHIIESMPPCVDHVIMAVNYRSQDLEEHFRAHDAGLELTLVDEPVPLGTGGALRNLREHLDGTFMMFNGDLVCSLDREEILRRHRESGGIATMALWEVEEPWAYGVAELDREGRVVRFQEKPAPGEEASRLINAGIYVFEPEILERIPEGRVSLEREVFPRILGKGMQGHRFQGHWADCGTREGFLQAQRNLLADRGETARCHPSSSTDGAVLGRNVYVGEGARVGPGALLEDCAVMRGARVGAGARLRGCIIGPGENVIDGAVIYDEIVSSL